MNRSDHRECKPRQPGAATRPGSVGQRLFSLLVLITALSLAGPASCQNDGGQAELSPAHGNGQAALQAYLERFELHDLLIRQVERSLNSEQDPARRQELAGKLSELYGQKLSTDQADFEKTADAWDALAEQFPAVIQDTTRLSIAAGHYRRARAEFDQWMWRGNSASGRAEIQQQFANLVQHSQRLVDAIQTMPDSGTPPDRDQPDPGLVLGDDTPETPTPEQEVVPLPRNQVALQAEFLLAWSLYYQAITEVDPADRTANLVRASEVFHGLLRIPANTGLTSLRPQWFALDSPWLCRILSGQGMVAHALEQRSVGDYCFALLADPRTPPQIRQLQRVYRFQSLFLAGLTPAAAALARQLSEEDRGARTDTGLWRTVALAGLGPRITPGFQSQYDELSLLGLGELVKQHDWVSIDQLFEEFDRTVPGDGFLANWLAGYRHLQAAIRGTGQAEPAINRLTTAVELASGNNPGITAEQQFTLRARCRYHLGFALYLGRQYAAAVDQFRQATAVLHHFDRETAEHGLWMQCQALERLASIDPVWQPSFLATLDDFRTRYPDSPQIANVEFLHMLVELGKQQPQAAIDWLQSVPASHPNYLRACFELARLTHQQWRSPGLAPDEQQSRGRQLISAAEVFWTAAKRDEDSGTESQLARICLLAADVLLHQAEPDAQAADNWLARCRNQNSRVSSNSRLLSDYHYLDLVTADLLGDAGRQELAANWLAEQSLEPAHRRAGLLFLASSLDRQLQNLPGNPAADEQRNQLVRSVIDLYQQALNVAGEDSDTAAVQARSRLASLLLETGQLQSAHDQFVQLCRIDSRRVDWLQGLARTETRLKMWEPAIDAWQRIAGGSAAGNNDWLEAKYQLVTCLSETRPELARQVCRQAMLLVPEMPAPWADRFDKLWNRLQ